MFNVRIDVPKSRSYYPKKSCFSLTYVIKNYYHTWMLRGKICYMETNINFRDPRTDPLQCASSRTLFYSITMMPKIFIEDFSNPKQHKNVRSINNTTSSHLVSCRVIPRPSTMKEWEKDVFWKNRALGNLKCNKSYNLKFR